MKNSSAAFFEIFFLVFVASFFLTLGVDLRDQLYLRLWLGGILSAVFFIFFQKESPASKDLTVLCFFSFLGFILIRFLGTVFLIIKAGNLTPDRLLLFPQYLYSPFRWSFYFVFFLLSFCFFRTKARVHHLLWTLAGTGFFLAINAIPPFLLKGEASYLAGDGQMVYFHPLFYSCEVLSKYVFGRFSFINYVGDLIALGFFPAWGLFFREWDLWRQEKETKHLILFVTAAFFCAATALGVVLFLSRGTLICFFWALIVYLFTAFLKFPSRSQSLGVAVSLFLVLVVLFSTGTLKKGWNEIRTLQTESEKTKESISTNREGARRAVRIYLSHPLLGVGTEGYLNFSLRYGSPKPAGESHPSWVMADHKAMCHYLQVLAEEGIGAFFYFLFLLAYFFESIRGFFKTKSRFQFISSLSLFAPVFMVLSHAAINHLMQQFSISILTYIFMGATLALFRPDFE